MTKSNPQLSKEVIYLQVGEIQEGEERTWCEDKINETDIKYIRADKVAQKIELAVNKERGRTRRAYCEICNKFIDINTGERS